MSSLSQATQRPASRSRRSPTRRFRDHYDVEQSDDGGASSLPSQVTSTNGVPTAVTGLTNGTATLSTTLTDTRSQSAVSGATVTLTSGTSTSGLKKVTTTKGVVSVSVHPTANTTYTWRYAGSATHAATTSSSARVSVQQVEKASLSTTKIKHGKTAEVYGTVSPSEKGKVVIVQELVKGAWKNLAHPAAITMQLSGGHRTVLGFVYSYKPAKKGKEKLRVTRAATSSNAAGVSATLSLTVT
jgi:hypothetical protein